MSRFRAQNLNSVLISPAGAAERVCKSTHTSNKRLADQVLSRWETEVFERRYYLPKSSPPLFADWADEPLLPRGPMPDHDDSKRSIREIKIPCSARTHVFGILRFSRTMASSMSDRRDSKSTHRVVPALFSLMVSTDRSRCVSAGRVS